jgi:hypothetical protein
MKSYHTSQKAATTKITPFPSAPFAQCAFCKRFDCRSGAHHALVRNAEAYARHERENRRGMKEAA